MNMYDLNDSSLKSNKAKKFKILTLLILTLGVVFTSLLAFFQLSEIYFFDKLFYRKSLIHGYWPPKEEDEKEQLSWADFGSRGQDLEKLIRYGKSVDLNLDDLSSSISSREDDIFTVAVIGDSCVWGQGLRNSQRFPVILEKKLNRIKQSKVMSFGAQGDSVIDNLIKFNLINQLYEIDLFIFALMDNDLFFIKPNTYNPTLSQEILAKCERPYIFTESKNMTNEEYLNRLAQTYSDDFGNSCVLDFLVKYFPTENSLYMDYGQYSNEEFMSSYKNAFLNLNQDFDFISIDLFANLSVDFQKQNPYQYLHVSNQEKHPSAYVNRVIADQLLEAIKKDFFTKN